MNTADNSPLQEPEPELVGASEHPIKLTGLPQTVTVDIDRRAATTALETIGAARPEHIYLSIEDIEGETNPGTVYGFYINLPADPSPAEVERRHAGNVSFFGIERARHPRGDEQAHNLQLTREITKLASELAQEGQWDEERVAVTFRPLGLIPYDRPEHAHALPEQLSGQEPPVTIGRVSVLYG
jgi:tyrosinase